MSGMLDAATGDWSEEEKQAYTELVTMLRERLNKRGKEANAEAIVQIQQAFSPEEIRRSGETPSHILQAFKEMSEADRDAALKALVDQPYASISDVLYNTGTTDDNQASDPVGDWTAVDHRVKVADRPRLQRPRVYAEHVFRSPNRTQALDRAVTAMHARAYGGMYTTEKTRREGTAGFMRRSLVIEELLANVPDKDKDARRRELADKTESELQDERRLEIGRAALIYTGEMNKEDAAAAGIEKINEALAASKVAAPIVAEQLKLRDRRISEQASAMRTAYTASIIGADKTGKLAKEYGRRRDIESGIREPDNGMAGDFSRFSASILRTGSSEATLGQEQAVFTLGSRYGIDIDKVRTQEDVKEAKAKMVFAEATAGQLQGREREAYLRQAGASTLTSQQRQQVLNKEGIQLEALTKISQIMDKIGGALVEQSKTTETRLTETQAERYNKSLLGIAVSSDIMKRAGLQIEVDADVYDPRLSKKEDISRSQLAGIIGASAATVSEQGRRYRPTDRPRESRPPRVPVVEPSPEPRSDQQLPQKPAQAPVSPMGFIPTTAQPQPADADALYAIAGAMTAEPPDATALAEYDKELNDIKADIRRTQSRLDRVAPESQTDL